MVAALYKFTPLPSYTELRAPLTDLCRQHGILGTLLLAHEGINGTIAGTKLGIDTVLDWLKTQAGLEDLKEKRSFCAEPPFLRMKVRLKKEIVTIGDSEIDPIRRVGTYVDPRRFDDLLNDPEVVVIDTRNRYETRVGTFEGAVDPEIDTFREFPDWVSKNLDPARNKRVAMFCTGGIRCEKASSLLLREGFEEVFHLEGGILRYLETTAPEESQWRGECFVFDHRVSVDAHLRPGQHSLCFGCLQPLAPHDLEHEHYEYGVSCPRCFPETTEGDRARRRERQLQIKLARRRGESHLGPSREGLPSEDTPGKRINPEAHIGMGEGVLYSFRRCPYAMRARMALAAGGMNPELREVELRAKPPAMLALGSTTVPVLQLPDGRVFKESIEIMGWVREQYPQAMPYRDDPRLSELILDVDGPFKAALDRYKYPSRYPDEDTSGAWDDALPTLVRINDRLQDDLYLDGEHAGFHDAAVFPFVRQFHGVEPERFEGLAELRALVGWRARMAEHPWFLSIMAKLKPWKEGSPAQPFKRTLQA